MAQEEDPTLNVTTIVPSAKAHEDIITPRVTPARTIEPGAHAIGNTHTPCGQRTPEQEELHRCTIGVCSLG